MEHIENKWKKISYEKNKLNKMVNEFKDVSKSYHHYLFNNPYKLKFSELKEKIENQRELLIKMIPDVWLK